MRVILNYLDTGGMYGIKRYALELAGALRRDGLNVDERKVEQREWRIAGRRVGGLITKRMRNVWPTLARGLVHAADYNTNPLLTPADVVTVHDMIPLIHPDWGTAEADRRASARNLRRALRTAKHVVTDTEHVKQQLVQQFGADPDRITAIHLGVRDDVFYPEPATAQDAPFDPAMLNVVVFMDLDPRKRADLVLRAAAQLPFVRVVHAGRLLPTPTDPSIVEEASKSEAQLRAQGRLTRVERPDDASLRRLFSTADLVVHPSLAEGFGFPVLEALRCGARVLASDIGPHRETLAEAGRFFEPSVEGLVEALNSSWDGRLDESFFPSLETRLARAQLFTWQRTARETRAVYERVDSSR